MYLDNFEHEADHLLNSVRSPEYEYVHNEFYEILRNAIESLPPKRKLVFKMIKEEGLKYHDVARILDLSVKTVETHMGLALKTVHACISNYKRDGKTTTLMYAGKNKR